MSDIRVGDQIRLSTYEGYVGLGTPEAHSIFVTRHEGVVRSTGHSARFGQSVQLDCSVPHEDLDVNETHYLEDFEVERLNAVTCTSCGGRGAVQPDAPQQPTDSSQATGDEAPAAVTGVSRIGLERTRQITVNGHAPAADFGRARELMAAAECYLDIARYGADGWHNPDGSYAPPGGWPWSEKSWHPADDRVANLTIAGALIAAAIDATTAT